MKDTFDKIITSAPINATAGRVMSRGAHWKPEAELPPGLMHWDAPPPMRPWIPDPRGVATNFTGAKFGRFTVVGLLDVKGGKNRGERWVCKCVCGDYEARSGKAILTASLLPPETLSNQCFYCLHWASTKIRYGKKGAKPLSEFINPKPKEVAQPNRPETIIAEMTGDYEMAVKIVAKLNSSGFRILRGDRSGILNNANTSAKSEEPK